MKRIFLGLFVLLIGFSFRFYREWQIVSHEQVSSWSETHTADCAVVLTGGAGRIREGFDLLSNHYIKKLIISGVHMNTQLSDLLPLKAVYGDVNEEDIAFDRRSGTTFGNAQQSLPLVQALNCHDILLVTSKTHMYRAFQTFKGAFPEAFPIIRHSVYGSKKEQGQLEIFFEALKSLFYSLWAY